MNESGLRFDETVPVTTIEAGDPAAESIPESERVVVGEKVTHRLAQRPASYEVLRYVRPAVKRRDTGELLAARAPANVLDRTSADVSLLAGMLVDKFRHHLPLHRQHRRMADAGIRVSRASLTNWAGRAVDLLRPVAAAQTAHVLESRVLAMDETPVKAGVKEPGRMRQGYFWPIYGEDDEIVFPFAPTREHRHVEAFLGEFRGTLASDGYEAYARYAAKRAGVRHAQCWAHARRGFEQARDGEPESAGAALALIGALYASEKTIRARKLKDAAEAGVPARAERSGGGAVLRLVPQPARAARPAAAQSAGEGAELRAGTRGRAVGASVGRRRGDRHEPPGKGAAADPGRAAQLAVRVDGARRRARRRGPGPARDLHAAGGGSVHLPRRRAAAPSGATRRRAPWNSRRGCGGRSSRTTRCAPTSTAAATRPGASRLRQSSIPAGFAAVRGPSRHRPIPDRT